MHFLSALPAPTATELKHENQRFSHAILQEIKSSLADATPKGITVTELAYVLHVQGLPWPEVLASPAPAKACGKKRKADAMEEVGERLAEFEERLTRVEDGLGGWLWDQRERTIAAERKKKQKKMPRKAVKMEMRNRSVGGSVRNVVGMEME
jgi:hypothetical protein